MSALPRVYRPDQRGHSEKELFETVPVPRAVAALAVPTVISQVVSIIYNLADTFFIGQMKNPYIVAAVSQVYPWFSLLTALGNLFGIGGSSLISRMLGARDQENVKYVSAFSICGGTAATLAFSGATYLARIPILTFLGASSETIGFAEQYLIWVVVIGGLPTMLSLTLAHLLRSEGHAKKSSTGMMLGGVLNAVLDPIFIFGLDLGVIGAAMATALSNTVSMAFFLLEYHRMGGKTAVSLHPKYCSLRFVRSIFSVGLASALSTTLASTSSMVIVKLAAGYTLQAMGKGPQSAVLTLCRQGLVNIPLLVAMNLAIGLYGMVWTQLATELIMLPISLLMYYATIRTLALTSSASGERDNNNERR